eukprot:m51a1_g1369 hypothetical protein (651) ;mRNA; f:413045-415661
MSADEALEEEAFALDAIFGPELTRFTPRSLRVLLAPGGPSLAVELPQGYPATAPALARLHPPTHPRAARVAAALRRAAEELVGSSAVFSLVSVAREALASDDPLPAAPAEAAGGCAPQVTAQGVPQGPQEQRETLLIQVSADKRWWEGEQDEDECAAAVVEAAAQAAADDVPGAPSGAGGSCERSWEYVVGLVGKPSSGKSTLFNAASGATDDRRAARMAAHPFTTIAPNVGRAIARVPCPCVSLGLKPHACRGCSAPGSAAGHRAISVVVKDVAGLVPGAYQGRGRGNRFLDDLTDADALVHVVDASGETDSEGRALHGAEADDGRRSSPEGEVAWVRAELHRWVFDNVRAKWAAVRRRPERLPQLFSGYHADRSLVRAAMMRAGVDPTTFSLVPKGAAGSGASPIPPSSWTAKDLHLVVAHFLRVRFPVLVALNKADTAGAAVGGNLARVLKAFPNERCVPVCARGELLLQHLVAEGAVSHADGSNTFELLPDATDELLIQAAVKAGMRAASGTEDTPPTAEEVRTELQRLKENVLDKHGSTGVTAAMSTALAMRRPVAIFPVADLDTLAPLTTAAGPGPLRDCLLMRPGSTVGDAFEALKKEPNRMLGGDYVHAEALDFAGRKRVVHKSDALDAANSVLRIVATRKL